MLGVNPARPDEADAAAVAAAVCRRLTLRGLQLKKLIVSKETHCLEITKIEKLTFSVCFFPSYLEMHNI